MGIPNIQIKIDEAGAKAIVGIFGADKLRAVVKRGMERGLRLVHEKLPPYPPPRTFSQVTRQSSLWSRGARRVKGRRGRWWASTYRRTGTLGKSITYRVREMGDAIEGVIGTNVSRQTAASGYASYVIGGPGEQAWMHQGRWWQLPAEVEKRADEIAGAINEEIGKFLST